MASYAAPKYMNNHIAPYEAMPPGHRFGLFFKSWNYNWGIDDTGKKDGLKETLKLDKATIKMLQALRLRQASQALSLANPPWRIGAISEAPFMTGIGMEHPLENGFAFLNPYGLPYLPGSGVKGVLRRAAEELALDKVAEGGWDLIAVWWLFGFDASSIYLTGRAIAPLKKAAESCRETYRQQIDKLVTSPNLAPFVEAVLSGREKLAYLAQPKRFLEELITNRALRERIHLRGALCFWDVVPEPGGDQLGMDILTPHYGDYYQGKSAPNDCGQPIPNQFLVLPAGSHFLFHVQCNASCLPNSLAENWREFLETAFEQAFDWLGFGAKTAVGYGQMRRNEPALERTIDSHAGKDLRVVPPTPAITAETLLWESALLIWAPGNATLTVVGEDGKKATAKLGGDRSLVPAALHKSLFDKKKATPAKVTLKKEGNLFEIVKIEEK